MLKRGVYGRRGNNPGQREVYLRVREINGDRAVCDELVLAEHEEDDRVFHNLVIPLRTLESGFRTIDDNNPLIDLLYPIYRS